MKKILILLTSVITVATLAATSTAKAQDYDHAIGITVGNSVGINYKTFLGERSAIEADFNYYYNHNAPMLLALYQYHIPLLEGFKLYVGGGVNLGAIDLGRDHSYSDSKFAFGVDPTVGFEYKFNRAPVALALDYTPMINFFGHSMWGNAALKVRFTL